VCLFTVEQIVPRLIEQDDVISYEGGAENGSCLGRWNGLRQPCLHKRAHSNAFPW